MSAYQPQKDNPNLVSLIDGQSGYFDISTVSRGVFVPVGLHTRVTDLSGVVSLTAPATATKLIVQPKTKAVNMTLDGTDPTTVKGFEMAAGSVNPIAVVPGQVIKLTQVEASASADYQFGR